jgi:hypothetical protein
MVPLRRRKAHRRAGRDTKNIRGSPRRVALLDVADDPLAKIH